MRFEGPLFAINAGYEEVSGEASFPDLRSLPEVPDAVLVGVNRDRVLDVVEEAAELGVPAAVILAEGFGEAGADGQQLQRRLADAAARSDMAVLGPNCVGVINFAHPSALFQERILEPPRAGHVGLISQGGTVTMAIVNNVRGVRFSFVAATGNEAVVDASDVLEFLVADQDTRVITAFLETIRSPKRFFAACDAARDAGKPVIVLKSGRTEAAAAAALTHTGALAPPYRQVTARLRRAGVVCVDSLEELLETAVAMTGTYCAGPRVGAITFSGSQTELLLDAAEGLDLEFPPLAAETRTRIEAFGLHATNPLDAWTNAFDGYTDDFEAGLVEILRALCDDPNIDSVVTLVEAIAEYRIGVPAAVEQVAAVVQRFQHGTDKQISLLTTLTGSVDLTLSERLAGEGIPLLSGLRQGLVALDRAGWRARHNVPRPRVAVLGADLPAMPDEPFSGAVGLDVLRAAGLDVVPTTLVPDAAAAADAAGRLGYPVVLKTGDPSVLHKTELDVVAVGLGSDDEVRAAARRIDERLPGAPLLVQPQADGGGVEMILGLKADPELGTFVLLGLGGVWAEIFDDVTMRALPFSEGEAAEMLDELRAKSLLEGARGAEPLDRDALIRAIERLAALGEALDGRFESIDVNPLFVRPHGAIAVDAVFVPSVS
jgi:acyl-CoA synthetase (NDP forming)